MRAPPLPNALRSGALRFHLPYTCSAYNCPTMDTRFIYRLLDDLQYPVEKDDILLHAQLKGVGNDMYDLLLRLPYNTYDRCEDIIRELPLEEYEHRVYDYL